MKVGQLIKYNVRNIFLEKSYIKCGGNTSPRPFSKKSKLSIFLDQQSKAYTVCFYCMWSGGLLKFIETKMQTTCFYLIKPFQKAKRGLELLPLSYFLDHFWRKIFFTLYSINWPNFVVLFSLYPEILANVLQLLAI